MHNLFFAFCFFSLFGPQVSSRALLTVYEQPRQNALKYRNPLTHDDSALTHALLARCASSLVHDFHWEDYN